MQNDYKQTNKRTSEVQLFCPHSRCSARLENRDIKGEIGTCPKCRTKVCTKCKNEEHRGVCKENELVKLAKDKGWKGCPKCGRMVDKLPGTCNHVTCQCGQHFCYKCGRANKGRYENAKNGGCDCPIWNSGDLQQAMEMEPFNPEWAGALEPERDIDEPELVEFADGALFGRQDRRQHFEGGFDGFRAAAEVARRNAAPIDPPPHRLLRGGIPWGYLPGGIPVDPPILWEDLPPVPQFSRGFGGADLGRGSGARGFVRRPFHLHPPPPPPFGKYWGGPWDRDPDRRSW